MPPADKPDKSAKPAKVMFATLADAVAGKRIEPLKGDLGGLSVNKRLMLAALELYRTGDPGVLLALLVNMRDTGHMSLRTGNRIASEAGSPGMHWSFSIAALSAVYRWLGYGPAADDARRVLLDECGLCRPFAHRGQVAIPAPRVERAPIDGYRDMWLALAIGCRINKGARYFDQPEALAVRLMRDMIRDGLWDADTQKRARNAAFPRLYLPIHRTVAADADEWVAWIEHTPEAETQTRGTSEGLCDWVHAGPHGITYGHNWQTPVPPLPESV